MSAGRRATVRGNCFGRAPTECAQRHRVNAGLRPARDHHVRVPAAHLGAPVCFLCSLFTRCSSLSLFPLCSTATEPRPAAPSFGAAEHVARQQRAVPSHCPATRSSRVGFIERQAHKAADAIDSACSGCTGRTMRNASPTACPPVAQAVAALCSGPRRPRRMLTAPAALLARMRGTRKGLSLAGRAPASAQP